MASIYFVGPLSVPASVAARTAALPGTALCTLVTVGVYELLERELGADRVLRDEAALEAYGRDESSLGAFPPDAAVLARSREEIEIVLRLAAEHAIPVTPRGAGSGMTGGALPVRGGLVLSTEAMRGIRLIDPDDRIAIVEPGVITGDLQRAAEEQGLFYAPDPASLAMCSLGGNVAENAGGPRAFKYGVTRDWTLGMTVTLMGGETLKLGRKTPKGVTGYDLVAMFVGSEGTFGVTSEITVRLIGKPEAAAALIAVMPDAVTAGRGRQRHHPPRVPAARPRAHGPVIAGPRPFPGGVHVSRRTPGPSCCSSSTAKPTDWSRPSCAAESCALNWGRPRSSWRATRRTASVCGAPAASVRPRCATPTAGSSPRTWWSPPARSPRCCGGWTRSRRAPGCSPPPSVTPATATCT